MSPTSEPSSSLAPPSLALMLEIGWPTSRRRRVSSGAFSSLLASSSSVASRPSSTLRELSALRNLYSESTTWAGRRTVRAWSAMARVTACLIHQVAYVEKRLPISGSNFSTALMSPAFPSWMRSSKGTPRPRYFLAIEITSRRLDSMRRRLAASSPSWARLLRSRSSPASSSLPSRTLPRYCVRTSCASIIAVSPLRRTFYAAGCDPPTRGPPCVTNRLKILSSRLEVTLHLRPHEHPNSRILLSPVSASAASLSDRRQQAGRAQT